MSGINGAKHEFGPYERCGTTEGFYESGTPEMIRESTIFCETLQYEGGVEKPHANCADMHEGSRT